MNASRAPSLVDDAPDRRAARAPGWRTPGTISFSTSCAVSWPPLPWPSRISIAVDERQRAGGERTTAASEDIVFSQRDVDAGPTAGGGGRCATSWMRWIDQLGTTNAWSHRSASAPPSRPAKPMVQQRPARGRAASRGCTLAARARGRDAEHDVAGARDAARADRRTPRAKSASLPIGGEQRRRRRRARCAGSARRFSTIGCCELDGERAARRTRSRRCPSRRAGRPRERASASARRRPRCAPRWRCEEGELAIRSALSRALRRIASAHATIAAPAVLEVRGARALGRDHRRAERRLRRARRCRTPGSRTASSGRAGSRPLMQRAGSRVSIVADVEDALGVVRAILVGAAGSPTSGSRRRRATCGRRPRTPRRSASRAARLPSRRDRARVLVLDLGAARLELLHGHEDALAAGRPARSR